MARLTPPLPPNRTGGSPASGFPVSGCSLERERFFTSSPSTPVRRSVPPKQLHSVDSTAGEPLRALALVFFSVFLSCALPPSCVPSLHGHYPLLCYYERSDSRPSGARTLCPTHPPARPGLPDYCTRTSVHSVSNHLRVDRGSPGCQRVSPAVTDFVFP